ncbi:MAG: EVE domain-containing protein [Verrucomicrobiaceae bacterium]|nr:MAG: EVE domain-containing protein [Verrucomicrobiaceae bacterium]
MPTDDTRQYWMVKQEPEAYSWDDFLRDGSTAWTGVRNFQARNNLRSMHRGDHVLFYHSVTTKAVIGIAEVSREAFPDPTAEEGDWDCVELKPLRTLTKPVSLQQIKTHSRLKEIPLVKQSRLSVIPLNQSDFEEIIRLAEGK